MQARRAAKRGSAYDSVLTYTRASCKRKKEQNCNVLSAGRRTHFSRRAVPHVVEKNLERWWIMRIFRLSTFRAPACLDATRLIPSSINADSHSLPGGHR